MPDKYSVDVALRDHADRAPADAGPSISLIGSFRKHYDQVRETARFFFAHGIQVSSPTVGEIVNPDDGFVRFACDPPDSSDHQIQAATMAKLLASDAVYVVAPGGYVGLDTCVEIGHLLHAQVPLYFSEPPKNVTLAIPPDSVMSPPELLGRLVNENFRSTRPRESVKIASDLVVLTIRDDSLRVLLVERGTDPHAGMLALPGGFMRPNEDLEKVAARELKEETGLDPQSLHLEQLHTYSGPKRDPRGRVVTTAFLAIAPNLPNPNTTADSDARKADWYEINDSLFEKLAFDHAEILLRGWQRACDLLETTALAAAFCAEPFTMSELRRVYALVWGEEPDRRNFERKVTSIPGFVVEIEEKRKTDGRPATQYTRGDAEFVHPAILRPSRLQARPRSTGAA